MLSIKTKMNLIYYQQQQLFAYKLINNISDSINNFNLIINLQTNLFLINNLVLR